MKILLATDGSEASEAAARFLTRLDLSAKDEIIVLHVVSAVPFDDDHAGKIRHAIRRVAPKITEAASNILIDAKARVIKLEEEGYPDITITDLAGKTDTDLIVMGTSGVKGMQRMFLGSSTRAVAINSVKPLLAVRTLSQGRSRPMKVLFATDGSEPANATAKVLASMPFPRDTELTILNVVWSGISDIPERFIMEINEEIRDEVARVRTIEMEGSGRILEQASALLSGRFSNIFRLARTGDASREILNEASTIGPDILAVGSRGLRGVKGMLGSVSRRMLGDAGCSVLIGKA